jgi:hypothetical protein
MDDPAAVLGEAVSLMRQGRYEEALRKHVWFHDHALEHNPALAGVRLSFALSYWTELGQMYPEALRALTAIRDSKAKAIVEGEGSFDWFHDVAAINGYLDEEPGTVTLFKRVHQRFPALARQCYLVAEAGLVAQGEYELCLAYIPDPVARVEEIGQLRRIQLLWADEDPALGTPEFRDYVEQRFADEARRVMDILIGAGQRPQAEQVRELALAESDSAVVRAALDDALGLGDCGPSSH